MNKYYILEILYMNCYLSACGYKEIIYSMRYLIKENFRIFPIKSLLNYFYTVSRFIIFPFIFIKISVRLKKFNKTFDKFYLILQEHIF